MDQTFADIHEFQETGSNTCGPTSLAMVYHLLGQKVEVAEILADLGQSGIGEATYVPQLARHAMKGGFRTRLVVSSSKMLSPAWSKLDPAELAEQFKAWLTRHSKDDWHLNNLYLLFYLQEGGHIEASSYSATTIRDALDNGSVVVACVDEVWLWGHRLKRQDGKVDINEIAGKTDGHFVVVTGWKGEKFHVLDPFPTGLDNRHGEYWVADAVLVNASLTWDPQILIISK